MNVNLQKLSCELTKANWTCKWVTTKVHHRLDMVAWETQDICRHLCSHHHILIAARDQPSNIFYFTICTVQYQCSSWIHIKFLVKSFAIHCNWTNKIHLIKCQCLCLFFSHIFFFTRKYHFAARVFTFHVKMHFQFVLDLFLATNENVMIDWNIDKKTSNQANASRLRSLE